MMVSTLGMLRVNGSSKTNPRVEVGCYTVLSAPTACITYANGGTSRQTLRHLRTVGASRCCYRTGGMRYTNRSIDANGHWGPINERYATEGVAYGVLG